MKGKNKSKTVSPLRKFYKWKYSGLVVVPTACIIIMSLWFSYTSSLEFFDTFSCQGLIDYATTDKRIGPDIPLHSELTEEQHNKLHVILEPCIEEKFASSQKHN